METSVGPTDEEKRKEQLRAAGEQYFAQVLATAGAGKDPFQQQQPPPARRVRDAEIGAADPDLETVGALLEGSRLYVLSAAYVAGHAAAPVLIAGSLAALPTPAILVFLHSLPLVAALAGLSAWSGVAMSLGPLTVGTLLGAAPTAVVSGVQTLTLFAALSHGRVYLVLAWTALAPHLQALQLRRLSAGTLQLQGRTRTALGVAAGGLFISLLTGGLAGFAALFWLLLWSAAEAGRALWGEVKRRLDAGQPLPLPPGIVTAQRLRDIAAAEAGIAPPTLAFLQTALPAAPALILGFLCLEGRSLVAHELSVPAVSTILLSMLFWTAGHSAGVLLAEQAPAALPPRLAFAAAAVTLPVEIGVHGVGGVGSLLGAALAVGGAAALQHGPAS